MNKGLSLQDALTKFSGGNNEFFSLRDDKDTAVVRFLYQTEDDLDWYVVHACSIGDKKRWVLCTQDASCPICQSGNRPTVRLFLQLVDERDGQVKTWERGRTFVPRILAMTERYQPLYQRKVEIERHGRRGDTSTDYQMFVLDKDDTKWEDLPEKQILVGENGFILQKNIEDMKRIAQGTYEYEQVANPPSPANNPPQQRRRSEGVDVF